MRSIIGPRRFDRAMDDRALEWFSAGVMVWWAVCLALPGQTFSKPGYAAFQRFGMSEDLWVAAFGLVGVARLVALYINGRSPRTPHTRMVGALIGSVIWGQVAWMITEGFWLSTGIASPGSGVYALLALADVFSVYRAAYDARYHRS